ncbi:unnamed protein product [Onchocerca flexuosa]|uniref:Type IV pilin n=1 Tax=Onchocerca flexuosa TaxID=387005 RepID=A0A183HWA8_9BILA|nr:unnamed protein product [Onchocerca flexuosa]
MTESSLVTVIVAIVVAVIVAVVATVVVVVVIHDDGLQFQRLLFGQTTEHPIAEVDFDDDEEGGKAVKFIT